MSCQPSSRIPGADCSLPRTGDSRASGVSPGTWRGLARPLPPAVRARSSHAGTRIASRCGVLQGSALSPVWQNDRRSLLENWLRSHDIKEILVTGIRTEQCCETTTRHASDVGFNVQFVSDATLTFPMQSRAGRRFSTAEIRERTELVLDGRFARVVSTAEALG